MRDIQIGLPSSGINHAALEFSSSEGQKGYLDPSQPKGNILLIGNDPLLQETRAAVLERAGFAVITLEETQSVRTNDLPLINLVLICRTVQNEMARQIAASVRVKLPGTPILRFASWKSASTEDESFAESTTSTFITPDFLIAEVNRVISILPPATPIQG